MGTVAAAFLLGAGEAAFLGAGSAFLITAFALVGAAAALGAALGASFFAGTLFLAGDAATFLAGVSAFLTGCAMGAAFLAGAVGADTCLDFDFDFYSDALAF